MQEPLISIILPIYNVEKYLKRCIDSVINQTYKNLEIILVDDGSTDRCPEICDKYAKRDNRIKVIHKKNGGQSDARNAGIALAGGELIGFVDPDDRIHPDMYSKMYLQMVEDKSDIVSCSFVKEYESDLNTQTNNFSCEKFVLNKISAMNELLIGKRIKEVIWDKLYRAEIVKENPFIKGKYHEDIFWTYKAIGMAEHVSVTEAVYYYYFVKREESIMAERYSIRRLDALEAMELRCQYIKENMPELTALAYKNYIMSCLYNYQAICQDKECDKDGSIRKNIISRINKENKRIALKNSNTKYKIWFRMFFLFPDSTCFIRNKLKIGLWGR